MKSNPLHACICGGCPDCLRAQGYPTVECPDCNGQGEHVSEVLGRSATCRVCRGKGWVVDDELSPGNRG